MLALALAMVGAWNLQRRLTRGLTAITDLAHRIADDPTARHQIAREVPGLPADVHMLYTAFEIMLAQIAQAQGTLETRVAERTAEIAAAHRELETFSYSVSHDLQAPLRHIVGFLALLLNRYQALLPEDGQRWLTLVSESATQMGHLIQDLLTFSRLSRQPLTRLPVDLAAVAREMLAILVPAFPGREISIDIADLPPALGDAPLLRHVLGNLLGNALKFTATRAQAVITLGSLVQEGETVYYVRDNGVGFDMQYAGKLFGVFQRLHSGTEYEGTGVGLAICQRIILRHGGRIWAEAAVDAGATFFFTLGAATATPSVTR